MKKCPYCGKEYPDDATNCAIDNELLLDNFPQSKAEEQKAEPHLTFPDYKWSARDAWKCLGTILVLMFVMVLILAVIIAASRLPQPIYRSNGFVYLFVA